MILNGLKSFPPVINCYVKKLKLNQVAYHKKVFPSGKNPFLKVKIRNTFIVHILTLNGKN